MPYESVLGGGICLIVSSLCHLPSLQDRRRYLQLCVLFKICCNLMIFPADVILPAKSSSISCFVGSAFSGFALHIPFACSNSSFVPSIVKDWPFDACLLLPFIF